MPEMNINISGEDINKAVAKAILESMLGKKILDMVDEHIKKLTYDWNNPVKSIVEQEVRAQIQKVVISRIPDLEELVKKELTETAVSGLIKTLLKDKY